MALVLTPHAPDTFQSALRTSPGRKRSSAARRPHPTGAPSRCGACSRGRRGRQPSIKPLATMAPPGRPAPAIPSPVLGVGGVLRYHIPPRRILGGKQLFPHPAGAQAKLLAPRHGPQRKMAGAARQRLGDLVHQQQVGGAGQQELAGTAMAVDFHLDRGQERGDTLHLVQRDRRLTAHKGQRIASSHVQRIKVIQGDEAPLPGRQRASQGALPCLPGAAEHHCRHGAQTLFKAEPDLAWKQIIHGMNDIHSSTEALPHLQPKADVSGPSIPDSRAPFP